MNAVVLDAQNKFNDLLRAEYLGPGDMPRALDRLARRLGLASAAPLWALKYRPPKSLDAALYLQLVALHARIETVSLRVHADERARAAPKTVVGRCLVGLAAALDRANFGVLEGDAS